jgi:hypothetical protein
MNGLPLENGAACNTPARARETSADILQNRTPMGGYSYVLPVDFKNGHVDRFAEARRTPGDNLQHGLEVGRRSADDLENLRCRRLLFERLVTLAGKPRSLSFLAGGGGPTVGPRFRRIAAL